MSTENLRKSRFEIPLTEAELTEIIRKAQLSGLSRAAWAREVLLSGSVSFTENGSSTSSSADELRKLSVRLDERLNEIQGGIFPLTEELRKGLAGVTESLRKLAERMDSKPALPQPAPPDVTKVVNPARPLADPAKDAAFAALKGALPAGIVVDAQMVDDPDEIEEPDGFVVNKPCPKCRKREPGLRITEDPLDGQQFECLGCGAKGTVPQE